MGRCLLAINRRKGIVRSTKERILRFLHRGSVIDSAEIGAVRPRVSMFVIRRVLVVDPMSTSNDFGNELGHKEFDVKFDSVCNGEELNVTV